jgi:hypothetical protein
MKSLIEIIVVTGAVIVSAVFSSVLAQQSNEPVTREQVRQQLIELEGAGYNPARANDYNYPDDLQAAEARVAAQKAREAQAQDQQAKGQAGGVPPQPGVRPSGAPGTKP